MLLSYEVYLAKLKNIRGLVMDCDGVLTDGGLYYDAQGHRMLRFHARDGHGLACLHQTKRVRMGVLSGRSTAIVETRGREVGIDTYTGSCRDKEQGFLEMCLGWGIAPEECAFIGDDVPDLGAFKVAGVCVAVADACEELKQRAHWITQAKGGCGAVREVCDGWLSALKSA
jgi:3-deoxy-D-manno-octulosonate 8-phosphate phosphatase (KDO 8-P phosphatase)